MIRFLEKEPVQVTGLLLLAAAWKFAFVLGGAVPFNADEAVVALMARHILQGERPVFFYGQAYMGSLDAWLVAAGFALFGENVWVIRLAQGLLYLGVVAGVYLLAKDLYRSSRAAMLAGLLLAVPAVNTTVYTTASLGGYGEALLMGTWMLLMAWRSRQRAEAGVFPWRTAILWAFLAGLGWWANGLSLVFSVPTGLYLLWLLLWKTSSRGRWPGIAAMLAGFLVGSAPWWLYALRTGPQQLVGELFGGAVAVESTPWLVQVSTHL
ncbi:MAG TPA: glycosyltransferase family 39 protein, partial [Anaerolineaceae bacterium]|nr:glycosyltransferase family 39 protein [Anaerolineaceae bacterium]